MRYDAVILDLDGTLLNTLPDITEIVNSVTGQIGMSFFSEERIKAAVGSGVESLLRKLGVPDQWNTALAGEISSRYARIGTSKAYVYPGVKKMLDGLFSTVQWVCVLSNKPEKALLHSLNSHFPDYPFSVIKGSKPGNPAKPEPRAMLQILEELNVAAGRALMAGDGEADILAAKASGTEHIGVLWGFRTRSELELRGAVNFADSPGDVNSFVELSL